MYFCGDRTTRRKFTAHASLAAGHASQTATEFSTGHVNENGPSPSHRVVTLSCLELFPVPQAAAGRRSLRATPISSLGATDGYGRFPWRLDPDRILGVHPLGPYLYARPSLGPGFLFLVAARHGRFNSFRPALSCCCSQAGRGRKGRHPLGLPEVLAGTALLENRFS